VFRFGREGGLREPEHYGTVALSLGTLNACCAKHLILRDAWSAQAELSSELLMIFAKLFAWARQLVGSLLAFASKINRWQTLWMPTPHTEGLKTGKQRVSTYPRLAGWRGGLGKMKNGPHQDAKRNLLWWGQGTAMPH